MLFRIAEEGSVESVPKRKFAELGLLERDDIQEWIIEQPRILGEDLLIITSEFEGFEGTSNRLDVLALDRSAQLVVIELKRDRADTTADLQVLKYASFCATLTAEDVQQLHREFRIKRDGEDPTPASIRRRFSEFLDSGTEFEVGQDEWLQFDLTDQPRMLIAAGEFGVEVTSPVVWLYEEYGVEISCVRLSVYERAGEFLLQAQRIVPTPETEQYTTERRKKRAKQQDGFSGGTYDVLLRRGVLQRGDELLFNDEILQKDWAPPDAEDRWDPEDPLWKAVVTGKVGHRDNVRWQYDGEEYSITGLTKSVLRELGGGDDPYVNHAFWYWTHPCYEYQPLSSLREQEVSLRDRKERT